MTTKFKKSFSPMLICWNDIKIHLGFEDSYFVPPPIKTWVANAKHIQGTSASTSQKYIFVGCICGCSLTLIKEIAL